jgi:hypothetical protein
MLIGGLAAIGLVSGKTEAPSGPIWIWVPSPTDPPDYILNDLTVRFLILTDQKGVLEFQFDLTTLGSRQYGFAVLQPMKVLAATATTSRDCSGNSTELPTDLIKSGYLTRFWGSSLSFICLWLHVDDPVTVRELGKRTSRTTFWQYVNPGEYEEFVEGMDPTPIMNSALTYSISYPLTWSLSLTETSRLPDKVAVTKDYSLLSWRLDFHKGVLPGYYETLTAVWLVSPEQDIKNWAVLFGTLIAATGVGIGSGALRELLISRHRKPLDLKERPTLEEP